MAESEKKLSRTRAGKNSRVDPAQRIEWVQCSSPSCGKWRPIPLYMKSSEILKSCNSKWYCVLNSWDEAAASCGAPQETGYVVLCVKCTLTMFRALCSYYFHYFRHHSLLQLYASSCSQMTDNNCAPTKTITIDINACNVHMPHS